VSGKEGRTVMDASKVPTDDVVSNCRRQWKEVSEGFGQVS
jgi:hypothetical protein